VETIIDQLKAVNSKSFLEEIKKPENVKILTLENYNNPTKWNDLEKFINLEQLQLKNCFIENSTFFPSISKINKLNLLRYDNECFFKASEEKIKISPLNIDKIILDFNYIEDVSLSLLTLKDQENNFINSFPNYPTAYQNIKVIELNNYDEFLKKVKNDDYDFEYADLYNGKDLFYNCDIYNLSRLKKLENIKFSSDKDNKISEIVLDKILNLPNHKKIKINNSLIKDIKDSYFKGQNLYLDYTYYPYDDNLYTDIKKHSFYNDCIEVHWPSQKYHGYKEKFKELLKQEINHVFVGPTFDFMWETYVDYEGTSVSDFEKEFFKIRGLKKITFEFPAKSTNLDDDALTFQNKDYNGSIMEEFISFINKGLKKNIEIEIDFKDIKSFNDINEIHDEYIQLFYLYINIQNDKKLKDKFKIKNLTIQQCEKYFEQLIFNKFKSIVVIDDQSNSKILKKFKDVDFLLNYSIDWGLEHLIINSGLVSYELSKIDAPEEEVFKDFLYEDDFWWKQFTSEENCNNPGKAKVFVKKSLLDNSKKIIFNNLETISFHYVGKQTIWSDTNDFGDKAFAIPKSINLTNIKNLRVSNSPYLSLPDLKIFENLETLEINNHLDENKENFKTLPSFKYLKNFSINMYYPTIKEEEKEPLKNLENSKNLESINIDGIHTTRYNFETDVERWSLSDVKLDKISSLKKLKQLKINGISLEDLKGLKNLDNIEKFELINPTVITKAMNSDEGTMDPPMTEENLLFIKNMNNLTELKLFLPRFSLEESNFNPKKLVSLINPNLKELNLMCGYEKDQIDRVHSIYEQCISKLTKLEKLRIDINCINPPELKYNDKIKDAHEKAKIKRNNKASNPLIIDFKKLVKMKNLREIDIDVDPYFGIKTANTIEIVNCETLKKINLDFDYQDVEIDLDELNLIFDKIATDRQKFLIKMNKNKTYKDKEDVVTSRYWLNEEDKEKYDLIEEQEEREIEINNKDLSDRIFDTFKKKDKK
jgi:hypothetical protein